MRPLDPHHLARTAGFVNCEYRLQRPKAIFTRGARLPPGGDRIREIAKLAFPTPPEGANILYTVSYEDGPRINPQGSLKEGQSVVVKNWMIFNVTATDKS